MAAMANPTATTEAAVAGAGPRRRPALGPDRLTVVLMSLAGFLVMLALLASQLRPTLVTAHHSVVVLRRVYQTTVVDTVRGSGASAGGTSVSQSISSSGSVPPAAPTTRTS
jgi:hypothetical protein